MDEDSFVEMRSRRAASLAAVNPQTGPEKLVHCQKTNINIIRDKLEKMICLMKDYIVDASPGDVTKKFTEANKQARLKDLRSIMINLKIT